MAKQMILKESPDAAARLLQGIEADDSLGDLEDAVGETDCEHGCYVEPDGYCSHGYKSAGLTAGII